MDLKFFIVTLFVLCVSLLTVFTFIYRTKRKTNFQSYKNIDIVPSEDERLFKEYKERKIPNYLEHDKTLHEPDSNPKNLFRIWFCTQDKCGGWNLKQFSSTIATTKRNLPGWKEILFRDKDADIFLENEFGPKHVVTKVFRLLNYGVMQADFLRILLIYKYGGLYLDMKSYVNGKLPQIPRGKDLWVGTWGQHARQLGGDGEFQNWFIYGRKGSPILKSVIEKIIHNILTLYETSTLKNFLLDNKIDAQAKILILTGPIAYTVAIQNSPHVDSVYCNNSIHKVIQYKSPNIQPLNASKHYSNTKKPLLKEYRSMIHSS